MNLKFCLLAFVMVASPAWAGWEHVAEQENGARFLIDYQTIRKDGNKVKFWQLVNFPTPQTFGEFKYLSTRSRQEYDCKQEQRRFLTATLFESWNAKGEKLLTIEEAEKWQEIPPETVGRAILQKVCKAPAR
jgi:hypothetical protein